MFSLLIALIYISFISLGLPDSLLGSAWPVMRAEFGAPVSLAGLVSMTISAGTIISSLMSDKITRKFGPGLVNAASCVLTAVALLGFSRATAPWMLFLWAIPYGLGAGGVDAALNNFAALHCTSRQMSWLHCFWGVGASISPYIMSASLSTRFGWQGGYLAVSLIQICLSVVLFASLPLWKRAIPSNDDSPDENKTPALGVKGALKITGVPFVLISFFAYCALESTAGLWASTYLAEFRGVDAKTAAMFGSLFYLGITFGRFVNGFIADKFGDRKMIRFGGIAICIGLALIILPLKTSIFALCGLLVIGVGGAPIYPCIIHATPDNFGAENSQAIVGVQMACAYTGSSLMPPVFGIIARHISPGFYPLFMAIFAVLMIISTERLNKIKKTSIQG